MSTVSIILRTSERYIFLDRAIKDIMSQEYKSWKIILVNDGGDEKIIRKIIEENHIKSHQIDLITLDRKVGLNKAINVGAKAVKTPFVVVHDDDDTWNEKFLIETVTYLEQNKECKGVVTQSYIVKEKVDRNKIKILNKKKFNPQLKGVISIYDMLKNNQFPPISFVYRTEIYSEVGYFDEMLEVLEDWEFCLRFLMKHDIGVIEKTLANYHIRKQKNIDKVFKNTVTARKSIHQQYDTIIRNKYLRKDIKEGEIGLGIMLNTIKWSDGKIIVKLKKIIQRVI